MDQIDKIYASIDMQGYYIDKKFFPREVSICNDEVDICLEIDCGYRVENFKTIKTENEYNFQKHLIHGIPLESIKKNIGLKVHNLEQIEILLKNIYKKAISNDKYLFACKNQQVALMLERLDIPYLNLEKTALNNEACPKLTDFDKTIGKGQVWFCPLHTCLPNQESSRKKLRCSLRKSRYIWMWISSKRIVDSLIEEIELLKL